MTTAIKQNNISDQIFKLKQNNNQTGYLSFQLADTDYAININNIIDIVEQPILVYLSHISPPIIGMQFYNNIYIPILDFAGYRPYSKNAKLLILSSSHFRQDNLFGLVVDSIQDIQYFKQKDLIKNKYPFNNLLPSYYYSYNRDVLFNFLDIQDIANQID